MTQLCERCASFNIQDFRGGHNAILGFYRKPGFSVYSTTDARSSALPTQAAPKQSYLLSLPFEHVESHKSFCSFCELLYKSINEEYIQDAKKRHSKELYIHLRARSTYGSDRSHMRITHLEVILDMRNTRLLGYHGKIHFYASQGQS